MKDKKDQQNEARELAQAKIDAYLGVADVYAEEPTAIDRYIALKKKELKKTPKTT